MWDLASGAGTWQLASLSDSWTLAGFVPSSNSFSPFYNPDFSPFREADEVGLESID